jgi:cobalt-zinc-cadmium efflux system outer membrane protein
LDAAKSLFDSVDQAYKNGKTTNLHFLDAARTSSDIHEEHLDALYEYQRDILLLESTASQPIN